MLYRYTVAAALLVASSFSAQADITGGFADAYGQTINAVKHLNGSYTWGTPEYAYGDADEGSPIYDVPTGNLWTLTGGTGVATIDMPFTVNSFTAQSYHLLGTGTAEPGGVGSADLDFDIGTGKSFVLNNTQSLAVPQSFVLTLQIPYDVPTQLNIGVVGGVVPSQTAIDFSDCGAPGPSNLACTRGIEETMSFSFSYPIYGIPEGSTLTTEQGFQVTTFMVPEPSDYAFMLAGLAVLSLTARTRRSRTQCKSSRSAVGHNLPVANGRE